MIESAKEALPLSDEDYISLRHFVVRGNNHEIVAQVGTPTYPERTLWTYTLATKDLVAKFYLGDTEPIPGTNHMGTRRSAPISFALG